MLKQTLLKSIVANKFTAFQKTLSGITRLDDLTYEIDEAPLTVQVLSQAFEFRYIDLGDRLVRSDISYEVDAMRASKVSVYINLLLKKLISESEARDFVVAYYGVVATEDGMVDKIDRSFLGLLCKRFTLVEPVTTALAKFIYRYSDDLSSDEVYDKELSKDDLSYLEFLIDHGADPNGVVKHCWHPSYRPTSPMGIAGKQGNTKLAKYLIGKGADTHDLLVGGMRISTLIDAGIPPTIWPTAIAWDHESDAGRFIGSLNGDVTQATMLGEFKFLLESGINLNAGLPLHSLMYKYSNSHRGAMDLLPVCKAMIENGADVNAFANGDNAKTPLMTALYLFRYVGLHDKDVTEYRSLATLVSTLLELGASVTIKNDQGWTAVHYAAMFCPSLMPLLQEHIDRAPNGFTEALLFSGPQRCLTLLESSAEIDETSLQDVFQFSVRLRHQELVAHLSSRRFDVVAALEPLRTVDQKNSYERTYDYDLFKFMTKLSGPNLEPFWRDILIRDYRIKARKMAHDVLVAALGEAATQAIVAECDEAKVARQKLIRQKTRVLISRLHTLFACLRQYKIFAVDIDGSGWAPGDHGSEVAHAMICPNDLNEFGVANDSDMSICWTDTGYYKKEARGWSKKGRMQKAVTAVNIYYAAPTQSKSKEMASRITDIAVANGFQADWNGDTNQAVSLYLM